MRPMDPEHVALAEIDLSDPELWLAPRDHRERVFRTLRDEAPVQFFEEVEFPPFAKGPGYFAVTRYEDVWMASRNPQLFCSGQGTVIPDMPIEIAEFFGSMISMDDPRHYRLRSIVAKGVHAQGRQPDRGVRPRARPTASSTPCSRSTPTARATSSTRWRPRCRSRSSAR